MNSGLRQWWCGRIKAKRAMKRLNATSPRGIPMSVSHRRLEKKDDTSLLDIAWCEGLLFDISFKDAADARRYLSQLSAQLDQVASLDNLTERRRLPVRRAA